MGRSHQRAQIVEYQVGRDLKDRLVRPFLAKAEGKGMEGRNGLALGVLCNMHPIKLGHEKGTEKHLKGLMSVEVRQAAVSNHPLCPEHPAKIHGRQIQRD